MRTLWLSSVVAGLAAFPAEQDGAAALVAADRAFCEATRERGLEGWLGWFAPDAVVMAPDGRLVEGADAIRAYYESLAFPPPGFGWEPESGAVAKAGDLGYTVGSWAIGPPSSGGGEVAPSPSGRYLSVWKRQPDGSNRVVADCGGDPGFRTRLDQVDGPPLAWSSTTDRIELSASGDLAFAVGSWSARTAERERVGRFLTVWTRTGDAAWEIAAEIGFGH